jgi:haloacid dehalogenase superfamily, subfamily IA, variant 1 with third motif having Dx(3-4)D or Dx(3-4)E
VSSKPQLVLDIAGVLVDNLSVAFWNELASKSGTSLPILKAQLNDIRKDLWTGRMKELQFWEWLSDLYPTMNRYDGYELLNRTMNMLPAVQHLERWSGIADIHLLSNHCQEWLAPLLDQVAKHTTSITVSNQVGFCKPQPEIYAIVEKHMPHKDRIIYVDDQEKNFAPAQSLGWITLLADEQHRWIGLLEPILLGD